jgi:GT2 family glycosyltransferase/glycosyltransferase involved in cell wall biosynthesis
LAFYGAVADDANWRERALRHAPRVRVLESAALGPYAALRELAPQAAGADILLIERGVDMPSHGVRRLWRAAQGIDADVVCALGNAEPSLFPGGDDASRDGAALDRGCHGYAEPARCGTRQVLRSCALWRARAVAWLVDHPEYARGELPDALRGVAYLRLYVDDPRLPWRAPQPPDDARFPPPASALDVLRARIHPIHTRLPALPGADQRPVVLHLLHGWGGGAESFVRDLARADTERCHLLLTAHGHRSRRCYGETLALRLAGSDAPPLRQYPLSPSIAATALRHDGYRAVLEQLIAEFGVGAIMLSSLIGHSLDALRTGLPTLVVCHDYYPVWPLLHCDFGARNQAFDVQTLGAQLAAQREDTALFAERDADTWWTLRAAYIDALLAAEAQLVAPSAGVLENLTRLAPELNSCERSVVSHGFAPFADAHRAPEPPHRARLRVLVLGRIGAGKGEKLLAEIIPALNDSVDFHLLGCGKAGERFFGVRGVHIVLDYARDELPTHVARIAPDLALMPVSVAETFSYTLSELWALGVPPMACALGSLAERIVSGESGLLVEPRASAIVDALRALLVDRTPLATLRARLRDIRLRDTAAMAADYRQLLPVEAVVAGGESVGDTPLGYALAEVTAQRQRAEATLHTQRGRIAEMQHELEARADWGYRMERQFRERAAWAEQLQIEIDALHGRLGKLQQEFDERSAWALQLDTQLKAIYRSPPGWVYRGLRWFWHRLRNSAVGFRLARARGLIQRGLRSLRTRGFWPTLKRALGAARAAPTAPSKLLVLPDLNAAFAPFALPTSDAPRVSIVVPVYNQFHHTLACLRALAAQAGSVPFEVIVVDDCSGDETAARLTEISGIHALRNAQNLGFIGACNAGAAAARGEFVLFLNNDTAVQPGWLEALIDTYAQHRDVGLVGAMLIYPDGRLQEAGGIVFNDASGWNYGRGEDPAHPAYNYVREVDYCSGAAIMLRRALFDELGGFDTHYAPAYYEDTDLAFKVRARGLRVLMQPAAKVVHFEGITSGTDTTSGTKRYQVVNQAKFAERWHTALTQQPAPGGDIVRAREHRARGRMLIVDACTPMPDQDSGSVRMVNVMRALIEMGWKVSFLAENQHYDGRYTQALQQLGVEAWYRPWVGEVPAWIRQHGHLFDAALISRHYVASNFVPLLRQHAPHARIVFDTVDLHYLREERAARLTNDAAMLKLAHATKQAELAQVRAADVTLVVSPVEQTLLRAECPGARVEVVSNVHEVVGCRRDFGARRDLWFVGGFQHPPNVDAVNWFLDDIWPRIAERLPDAVFHVVGSRMPETLLARASERVRMHGFVENLDAYLDGCTLSVAPLRYGAGVKGKVNQSMAHGQPVVATPIAVEGMHLAADQEVMVAADAAAFADAVVRVYEDERLWRALSERGLDNVRRYFSFDAAKAALARVLPR